MGKSRAEGKRTAEVEEQQRGRAAKWGSAVAARDSKEKRVF